jgi:hypothetical protein
VALGRALGGSADAAVPAPWREIENRPVSTSALDVAVVDPMTFVVANTSPGAPGLWRVAVTNGTAVWEALPFDPGLLTSYWIWAPQITSLLTATIQGRTTVVAGTSGGVFRIVTEEGRTNVLDALRTWRWDPSRLSRVMSSPEGGSRWLTYYVLNSGSESGGHALNLETGEDSRFTYGEDTSCVRPLLELTTGETNGFSDRRGASWGDARDTLRFGCDVYSANGGLTWLPYINAFDNQPFTGDQNYARVAEVNGSLIRLSGGALWVGKVGGPLEELDFPADVTGVKVDPATETVVAVCDQGIYYAPFSQLLNREEPVLGIGRYVGITISGEVGGNYRIEYADSLEEPCQWATAGTIRLERSPQVWIDLDSGRHPTRFYRALRF